MSNHRATDFFERQDRARRNTGRLVSLLVLVVAFLSVGTYLALGITGDMLAMFAGIDPVLVVMPMVGDSPHGWFHVELGVISVMVTVGVVLGGGMLKTRSLRGGGSTVVEELGGTEVDASAADPAIRRYVNVVEEMSLASGVPVPRIYVLEEEPGINAFAAGYTINDAAVAITRGALRQLKRDELQGVIAHEFSHILNGDMRLNIRLIGVLHGILGIFVVGTTLLREASSDDWTQTLRGNQDDGAGCLLAIPGAVLAAVGFGGVFFSRLIKSAVCRQREYLADAAAVQFTRNPDAMARALKKVGGYTYGSKLRGAKAEMVSHMCFGNVASRSRLTHPPLEKRVQSLDPSFDPDMGYRKLDAETDRSGLAGQKHSMGRQVAGHTDGAVAGLVLGAGGGGGRGEDYELDADEVIESVGQTSPERLVYCASLLEELPQPLVEARSSLLGAMTIVYLLLLDEESKEQRRHQAEVINEFGGNEVREQADRLWPVVRKLDGRLRLPLMDLLVPTLRRMTEEQFEQFVMVADRLIQADNRVDFREFILEKLVLHHLEVAFHDADRRSVQFRSFSGVTRDIENVLSALASAGTENPAVVRGRFEQGREYIPPVVRDDIELRPRERWSYEMVGASLERLSVAAPRIKQAVIDACAHCVTADGEVVVQEVEMLRAVCEMLDVPLPPFIPRHTKRD